ncbi:polysaccharide deacetylase family protein [Algoriphagus sp. A40]|uniref:polysaccharide deacetylase family protein n=1 Tax=Algoriphagus sp. A40 TaxID=1945863 RepID=UPI0009866716|nr:polysaccharide deacetylase family protein [Algoriphagus sp. A40]OOG75280.1 polysaccharide deacetylase family protein [Algoriphagus sp. A40]
MVWHTVPALIQSLFPKRIWEGDATGNRVYLTFDDGPVPGVTDYVLEELACRGQKATFFMVGDNIQKHPALAREVLEAGNGIGNHTFHHLNGWKTSLTEYLENIRDFDRIAADRLGIQTQLFRPPYGMISRSQAKVVLETKKIVMWNVLTGDYERGIDPEVILAKSIQLIQSGSIVVLHDQQKTQEILPKFLPDFLDFLSEREFETALL